MTIQDAKQIKLADYLQSLGYTPVKQQGRSLWYKSPLRNETDGTTSVSARVATSSHWQRNSTIARM